MTPGLIAFEFDLARKTLIRDDARVTYRVTAALDSSGAASQADDRAAFLAFQIAQANLDEEWEQVSAAQNIPNAQELRERVAERVKSLREIS